MVQQQHLLARQLVHGQAMLRRYFILPKQEKIVYWVPVCHAWWRTFRDTPVQFVIWPEG